MCAVVLARAAPHRRPRPARRQTTTPFPPRLPFGASATIVPDDPRRWAAGRGSGEPHGIAAGQIGEELPAIRDGSPASDLSTLTQATAAFQEVAAFAERGKIVGDGPHRARQTINLRTRVVAQPDEAGRENRDPILCELCDETLDRSGDEVAR